MQSEPLPREPKRTHPATAILGLGSVGFAALMTVATPGGGIVFELFLTLFGLRQIAQWYFRTYELRPADLVIREGIITRREQIVPYNRVQQVDIHRGLLAQGERVACDSPTPDATHRATTEAGNDIHQ